MTTVLVTGGSGFLGRHLVEALSAKGYATLAPRSAEFNLETGAGCDAYLEAHGAIDVLIHSAAYYGGIGINQAEPATIFFKNCQMALNAFELARQHQIGKILPIGSACAYPGYLQGDLKEDDFWAGALHDSVEAYGFTKKLQLVAQKAYYKQHGIASNHLILTNLYGPHDVFTEYRSHVASALIKKFADAKANHAPSVTLWGDGSPIREFLFVKDAAEAIARAVALPHDPTPINIGVGVGTTIRELAELTADAVGYDGDILWDTSQPNGAARKVLDISRLRDKLGWEPTTRLQSGLRETVAWYLANKSLADARA
ncbi:MAG: NAD-dependent epimerase/dehydratase family protein [Vampirovibrionales bacterium]|nr:NAD-dependent epimerase/dehydratase family protein [Vampirovibrionales bacterium]